MSIDGLHNPDTTEIKWLYPPRFSDKYRFTPSRPDAVLLAPISATTKSNRLLVMEGGGWRLWSGGRGANKGNVREHLSSTASHQQIYLLQTASNQMVLLLNSILQPDIYPIELKYGEDTKPQIQLSTVQKQHEGLCTLHHPSRSLRYPPRHLCGCERHHLLQSHCTTSTGSGSQKELSNLLQSFMYMLPNLSIPDTHYYKLSSGAGFRSSLQPL